MQPSSKSRYSQQIAERRATRGLNTDCNCTVYTDLEGVIYQNGPHLGRFVNSGIRVHPASTNRNGYSNAFASWAKGVAADVVTDNAAQGPDGLVSASKWVLDATLAGHRIYQVPLGGTYQVFSCCLKAGAGANGRWAAMYSSTAALAGWFDLVNGVLGSIGVGAGGRMTALSNGWYLCEFYLPVPVGGGSFSVYSCSGNGLLTNTGDGVAANLFLFGAQAEDGFYRTPLVKTVGAAASSLAPIYDAQGVEVAKPWHLYDHSRGRIQPWAAIVPRQVPPDGGTYPIFTLVYPLRSLELLWLPAALGDQWSWCGVTVPSIWAPVVGRRYLVRIRYDGPDGVGGTNWMIQVIDLTSDVMVEQVPVSDRVLWAQAACSHWYLGCTAAKAGQWHVDFEEVMS